MDCPDHTVAAFQPVSAALHHNTGKNEVTEDSVWCHFRFSIARLLKGFLIGLIKVCVRFTS